jgi:hypothetical protein
LFDDEDNWEERSLQMMIIGCDFHPSWQMISWLDTETGETGERKLVHANGEAEQFYGGLTGTMRVGLESTGNSHWFVDMLIEMGHEVWEPSLKNLSTVHHRGLPADLGLT